MRLMHPLWHVMAYEEIVCPKCRSRHIFTCPSSIPSVLSAMCCNPECVGDTTVRDRADSFHRPHSFMIYVNGEIRDYSYVLTEEGEFKYED